MKEKRFIVSLTWQEVNGGEQGRIKGRIVAPEQLAAAQAELSEKPKQEQTDETD